MDAQGGDINSLGQEVTELPKGEINSSEEANEPLKKDGVNAVISDEAVVNHADQVSEESPSNVGGDLGSDSGLQPKEEISENVMHGNCQDEGAKPKNWDHTSDIEKENVSDGSPSLDDNTEILPSLGILPGESSEDLGDKETTPPKASGEESPSDVCHKVKRIKWKDIEVPIITQNNNGPCPLLAILNALILKGNITLPLDRDELTGGELVSVVGNALFDVPRSTVPSDMRRYFEQNTQDAVSILHKLLTGLDVNVKFSGVRDFEFTTELCIFDVLNVPLYHGWVVDPASEVSALIGGLSYNQLTNNLIAWREEANAKHSDELLLKAMLCEEFMASSVSQLTIHGLFDLGSTLKDEEIAVFFRNNHFSTIYKREGQIYQLLTDQGFLNESAVWETLNDIDATFSEFVTGTFQCLPSVPPDTAGDMINMTTQQQIDSDHQLAAMLQQEAEQEKRKQDEFNKMVEDLGLLNLSDEEMAQRIQEEEQRLIEQASAPGGSAERRAPPCPQAKVRQTSQDDERKKKNCVVL